MSKAALYQKIVKVMNEVGQLVKDRTVTDFSGKKMYNYLSEEQTTAELQQAFIKHGLVLFPVKVEDELFYIETFKKTGEQVKAPITRVRVTYKICDAETGESEELQSIGYGSDSQDKGSNKAMTGAFKYVQRQTFMISSGDDGDHTSSAALDEQYKRQASQSQPQTHQQANTATTRTEQGNTSGQRQASAEPATEPQIKMIRAKMRDARMELPGVNAFLGLQLSSITELPRSRVNDLIKYLDANKVSS